MTVSMAVPMALVDDPLETPSSSSEYEPVSPAVSEINPLTKVRV